MIEASGHIITTQTTESRIEFITLPRELYDTLRTQLQRLSPTGVVDFLLWLIARTFTHGEVRITPLLEEEYIATLSTRVTRRTILRYKKELVDAGLLSLHSRGEYLFNPSLFTYRGPRPNLVMFEEVGDYQAPEVRENIPAAVAALTGQGPRNYPQQELKNNENTRENEWSGLKFPEPVRNQD